MPFSRLFFMPIDVRPGARVESFSDGMEMVACQVQRVSRAGSTFCS